MLCVGITLTLSDFEIEEEEEEYEVAARVRERRLRFFSEGKIENFSVIFLKPSLSIYSIPLGLGLNYLALK